MHMNCQRSAARQTCVVYGYCHCVVLEHTLRIDASYWRTYCLLCCLFVILSLCVWTENHHTVCTDADGLSRCWWLTSHVYTRYVYTHLLCIYFCSSIHLIHLLLQASFNQHLCQCMHLVAEAAVFSNVDASLQIPAVVSCHSSSACVHCCTTM